MAKEGDERDQEGEGEREYDQRQRGSSESDDRKNKTLGRRNTTFQNSNKKIIRFLN